MHHSLQCQPRVDATEERDRERDLRSLEPWRGDRKKVGGEPESSRGEYDHADEVERSCRPQRASHESIW